MKTLALIACFALSASAVFAVASARSGVTRMKVLSFGSSASMRASAASASATGESDPSAMPRDASAREGTGAVLIAAPRAGAGRRPALSPAASVP